MQKQLKSLHITVLDNMFPISQIHKHQTLSALLLPYSRYYSLPHVMAGVSKFPTNSQYGAISQHHSVWSKRIETASHSAHEVLLNS